MQRVDPFVPARGQYVAYNARRPALLPVGPRLRQVRPRGQAAQARQTIEGIISAKQASRPTALPQEPGATPWRQSVRPATDAAHQTKLKRKKSHTILRRVRLPAIIIAVIGTGLVVPSLQAGEVIIGAYALFALIRGVSSRTTFILALVAMLVIVVALGLQGDGSISENFAVYTFLLLAVGTVSMGLEVRRARA